MALREALQECAALGLDLEHVIKGEITLRNAEMLPGMGDAKLHPVVGEAAIEGRSTPCNCMFDVPSDRAGVVSAPELLEYIKEGSLCNLCLTAIQHVVVNNEYLGLAESVAEWGAELLSDVTELLEKEKAEPGSVEMISAGMVAERVAEYAERVQSARRHKEWENLSAWVEAKQAEIESAAAELEGLVATRSDVTEAWSEASSGEMRIAFIPGYGAIRASGDAETVRKRLVTWSALVLRGERYAGKGFSLTRRFVVKGGKEAIESLSGEDFGVYCGEDLGSAPSAPTGEVMELASSIHFESQASKDPEKYKDIPTAIREASELLELTA